MMHLLLGRFLLLVRNNLNLARNMAPGFLWSYQRAFVGFRCFCGFPSSRAQWSPSKSSPNNSACGFFWLLLSVSTVHLHCTAVWTQQSYDTAQKNPLASVTSFQTWTSRTHHINECSIVSDHSNLVNSLHETLRDNNAYVRMNKSSHASLRF